PEAFDPSGRNPRPGHLPLLSLPNLPDLDLAWTLARQVFQHQMARGCESIRPEIHFAIGALHATAPVASNGQRWRSEACSENKGQRGLFMWTHFSAVEQTPSQDSRAPQGWKSIGSRTSRLLAPNPNLG